MSAVLALRRGCFKVVCSINVKNKPPCTLVLSQETYLIRRNFHKSAATGEIIVKGCEKLPDLTLIWPFHLWPSDVAANLLNHLQVYSGIPWWGTIIAGGVVLKLPLIFFNIYNLRRIQRFFVTSPRQMTHFVLTYFNNLVTKGEVHALKMANDERRFTIYREGLCIDTRERMAGTMFGHISYIPMYWIAGMHASIICGLHWMNRIQYVPLTTGGLPWCLDLTVSDAYLILPSLCVASALINLYIHPMHWLFPLPEFKYKHILPLSPLLAVGYSLLSSLPADIVLYLISANLTAAVINTGLKSPKVYSEFGLLSSSETLNRIIPPASLFQELTKSLDRQTLLLQQQREQAALQEPNSKLKLVEEQKTVGLLNDQYQSSISNDSEELNDHPNTRSLAELPSEKFVKKSQKSNSSDEDLAPHLNVKKLFYK